MGIQIFVCQFLFQRFIVSLFNIISCDAAVFFFYDLSPITVTIKEETHSFLHFIARLCAVLGGTFALTGKFTKYVLQTAVFLH